MRKATLRDRAEYALSRAMEAVVTHLPHRAALRLGSALGAFAGSPLGIRRETVESNLRRAFPEADDAWIERVTRECYRHLGREAIEMVRLSRMSREEIVAA